MVCDMKTSTAMIEEASDTMRIKKSAEYVQHCRKVMADAMKALNDARNDLDRARQKHEQLFIDCEKRAVQRRKRGQIQVSAGY